MRIFIGMIMLLSALSVSADKTTRKNLKVLPKVDRQVVTDSLDFFTPSPGMIRLTGYDKPLRSYRESIYVSNPSRRTLRYINLEITYFDEAGQQMHRRDVKLNITIPPGETRQLTFPSWDKQRNMYYIKSGKPRTSDGTPYSISAKITQAAYSRY